MSTALERGTSQLLAAQADVLEQIVRGQPLVDVLGALCTIVETQAGAGVRAAILLVDADGERLRSGAAPSLPAAYCDAVDGIAIDREVGTCCRAAATAMVVTTPDIASCPRWQQLKDLPLAEGLRAAWSMPILSSTGAVLGTFGTYFLEQREPTREEIALVEVLARTAALAIERQRSDDELRRRVARAQFLDEVDAATRSLSEPRDIMQTTARLVAEHLDADRCAYANIEDERVFVIAGDHTRGVPSIVGRWDVAAFGPACVAAMRANEPYVVEDSADDPRIDADQRTAYEATTIRAVICVPLHKDGVFTAAMAVHQARPRVWTVADIELVSIVVQRCWETLERARLARSLRDSEALYRTIVETSPQCVKLVAADGTLLQMNAAGLQMIEADVDPIGSCVYDVIAPEHRERFRAFNERVCRGEGGQLAFDIVGHRGTRRSMETIAVPLAHPQGGFTQLGLTRDVSERVVAERALEESRARLDYAVRLSGVGFWYCDLPFDELAWDVRVKDHFFLPPEARVTIDLFYERIHPEDREATRTAIDDAIANHASYDVVYRTLDPASGACKWIRALGGAAYAIDGTPVRFDGVTVDVTASRRDQERIARVSVAAARIHSARTLDGVLGVITEEAREIIDAHQAVTSITTGAGLQLINCAILSDKYAAWRGYTEKTTGAGIYALVCETNRPIRMTQAQLEAHPRWRNFSGEGSKHPPMRGWLAVPLVGRDGRNLGLVQLSDKLDGEFTAGDEAVLMQLARLASIAIENTRLNDAQREQDRRKDEFLATLAHELRNPLAPIRTGLQILQRGTAADQADKVRAMMERQLGHLVRMVDDLLDISRITLGKITLERTHLDLRAVLDSALETTRPLIESGGHELAVKLPAQPLPLDVDATRLAQVFANLVNNAAKYTPGGGRIAITAEVEGGSVCVRVSDTGVGIPENMLGRVFDMFTQVGRSIERSQGGLGIGLTLVRRLVEMHGGTVEAHSAGEDHGTTFIVRLPLAQDATAPGPTAIDPTQAVAGNSLRVLVVDDNIDGAETLAMLLEYSGNVTRLAHTGPDALTAAGEFQPDLVFLDIGLPGFDGYEVARRMRADPSLRQPMIVALTGWGSEDDRKQAAAAGFDRHLVKPIDASKLDDVLAAARP